MNSILFIINRNFPKSCPCVSRIKLKVLFGFVKPFLSSRKERTVWFRSRSEGNRDSDPYFWLVQFLGRTPIAMVLSDLVVKHMGSSLLFEHDYGWQTFLEPICWLFQRCSHSLTKIHQNNRAGPENIPKCPIPPVTWTSSGGGWTWGRGWSMSWGLNPGRTAWFP